MTVPILFQWGKNSKLVSNLGIEKCPHCNNFSHLTANVVSNNVRLYFIPIAKFNKQHFIVCSTCNYGWEISFDAFEELVRENVLSLNREQTLLLWNDIGNLLADVLNKQIDFEFMKGILFRKYRNQEYVLKHIECFKKMLTEKEKEDF